MARIEIAVAVANGVSHADSGLFLGTRCLRTMLALPGKPYLKNPDASTTFMAPDGGAYMHRDGQPSDCETRRGAVGPDAAPSQNNR